jgi:hypothetical protein
MTDKITFSTVRKMELELDKLEAQAQEELKVRKTRSLGLLRRELIIECRRRLLHLTIAKKQALATRRCV